MSITTVPTFSLITLQIPSKFHDTDMNVLLSILETVHWSTSLFNERIRVFFTVLRH